jgi:hypothetical protein
MHLRAIVPDFRILSRQPLTTETILVVSPSIIRTEDTIETTDSETHGREQT